LYFTINSLQQNVISLYDEMFKECSTHKKRKKYIQKFSWKTKRRWEYNTKMYLAEVQYEGLAWIFLAEDRLRCPTLLRTVTKLRVTWKEGIFLAS
jgi:hypothetical protein